VEATRKAGPLDWLERSMKMVAAACLIGMALVTGVDIALRATLKMPILGSEEIVTFLAVIALGFSLPYAHTQGSNIGVEMLVRRLPRKVRRAIKLCTDLVSMLLFFLVAWRMALYAHATGRSGEVSMTLELPKHYVMYMLALGFLMFAALLLRDVVRHFGKQRYE